MSRWRIAGGAVASLVAAASSRPGAAMMAVAWASLVVSPVAAIEEGERRATPGLVFEQVEHDFGVVRQGEAVAVELSFENRGLVPLTLSPPIVGCDCRAEIVGSADVAPGESGRVRFSCDTSRMSGPVRRTATVHSSEVDRRAVILTMRGEVVADVVVEPNEVYLGRVVRGERRPGTFAVRGGGAAKRVARGAATEGRYIDVAPAGDGRFDVIVRPDAPVGVFTQDVVVATRSARFAQLTVPVTGIVVEELPERRW